MVSAEHSQIAPNREKVDKPTSQRRAMPVVCQLYVLEEAPDSSDETGEVCGVLQLALPNFCLTPFVDGLFQATLPTNCRPQRSVSLGNLSQPGQLGQAIEGEVLPSQQRTERRGSEGGRTRSESTSTQPMAD